jgi:DNA replication protein DnaC
MSLPRLPGIFREHIAHPRPTTAVCGVEKWVEGFYKANKADKTFLLLHGGHGTGKSFAAAHALYLVYRKRLAARWKLPTAWGMPDAAWLGAYKATADDDLFGAAQRAPLLVLDDLGSEEATQKARMRIAEIVSERYNQRKFTILTMNEDVLNLGSLYNPRMADRVIGAGDAVYCGGESMRLSER